MRYLRLLGLLGICLFPASYAHAQHIAVGIGVGPVAPVYYGPAPVCAYGYYGYYPYACAPYGYYGPDWFANGVFIGAGPWFHGFYGRPYGFYGRGYYGRGYYGGRAYYGRRGYYGGGFRGGAHEFHGGGGFRGGAIRGGGGFHGGGHGRR